MNRFDQFHESREDLLTLLGGIVEAVAKPDMFTKSIGEQREIMVNLIESHRFLDLCYLLDARGQQIGDNVAASRRQEKLGGDQADRSYRPYYRLASVADEPTLTEPYQSSANGHLCITVAAPVRDSEGTLLGIIVADCELDRALALLEEDEVRRSFEPYFKIFYAALSAGLLLVSLSLGLHAFLALGPVWSTSVAYGDFSAPFQATILFTVALAVFDLSKTIFEEEVLLRKDVRRHSTTRRTLTRFFAAILIAVSIEGLMLVFKFALGVPGDLMIAATLLLTAAAMMISLGVYVYLGARAELLLIKVQNTKKRVYKGKLNGSSSDRVGRVYNAAEQLCPE
ncbi:PDC sensor domain-containing protein [Acidithiobacillus thiooxidans]|uniref:PDC sensor domain-containing protein n=1 Tax=Acidithiobacillus thiooxidans TaxID=930 RepID=UPI000A41652A|nr:PDC sensor domain-containing protein [Acidithiobacillus thiooxidans]